MNKFNMNNYLNKIYGCIIVKSYAYYDKLKKEHFVNIKCNKCGSEYQIAAHKLSSCKYIYQI